MGKKDEELKAVHSTVEESKKAINSFECMRKREKELEVGFPIMCTPETSPKKEQVFDQDSEIEHLLRRTCWIR